MKRFLVGEVAVLLVLVIVAVFVRLGIGNSHEQLGGTNQNQETTLSTEDTQVLATMDTTPQDSTPQESTNVTEPEQTKPSWMTFPEGLTLKAQQYFVYEVETGEYLACSGTVEDQVYPASITKIFTAYVALQYLNPKDVVTVNWDISQAVYPGSSVARIDWGDKLTVEMLVEAMLLPSGNDAAYILAVQAGREIAGKSKLEWSKAKEAFMTEMNAQAQELGLTGTHFANPDGIHRENHYTNYQDLAKIASLVLGNDTIMKYAKINADYVTFASGEERKWENTNELINPESDYYCPYALGLKTGQTPRAGSCLLSAFRYEGRTFVIGVFACPQIADRFTDTLQLFNKAIGITG